MQDLRPAHEPTLSPVAMRLLLDAPIGVDVALPRAGTTLENAHVFDAVARELQRAAAAGRVHVVRRAEGADALVREFVFRRLG